MDAITLEIQWRFRLFLPFYSVLVNVQFLSLSSSLLAPMMATTATSTTLYDKEEVERGKVEKEIVLLIREKIFLSLSHTSSSC